MDRLEELKAKYQSVLEAISQQGVQVSQVSLRDNKLFVQGVAPTEDAKNAVWNQIKAVDSSYSDLTCDLKVGAPDSTAGNIHAASPNSLATALGAAFRSDQTPDFPQMLSNLFSSSDGQQRAGLLNQLLAAAGPGVVASLPASIGAVLKGGTGITAEQAQQISPESIQNIAEHAQKNNPSIIDQVSGFYSEHPKVIQALGAGALAIIMSHMNKK